MQNDLGALYGLGILMVLMTAVVALLIKGWVNIDKTSSTKFPVISSAESLQQSPVPYRRWVAQAPLSLCPMHTPRLARMGRITIVVDATKCEICLLK